MKKAEKTIKEQIDELEESNHMKDLFSDIIRHDLLNHLHVIKGYTEFMLEEENDPQK